MWEWDCEESWVPKNWCFWTVVLEKTLESPLDCKEIQPVHSQGNQPLIFLEGIFLGFLWKEWCWRWNSSTLATSCEELTHWKRLWCWEGLEEEEKGTTEDEMAGWHHRLDGREFEWTPGVGDGQGGLVCYNSWGHKESDTTERLDWTELNLEHLPLWLGSPGPWSMFSLIWAVPARKGGEVVIKLRSFAAAWGCLEVCYSQSPRGSEPQVPCDLAIGTPVITCALFPVSTLTACDHPSSDLPAS